MLLEASGAWIPARWVWNTSEGKAEEGNLFGDCADSAVTENLSQDSSSSTLNTILMEICETKC